MTDLARNYGITREYGKPFFAFDNTWAFESITHGKGSNGRPWKSSYVRKGYASAEAAYAAIQLLKAEEV